MNQQTSSNPDVSVTLTAHQEGDLKILMARIVAASSEQVTTQPVEIALVIDRSGSMSGQKLEITKQACARLIRALNPQDKVAVVMYDDQVNVIGELTTPTNALANVVERIGSGGSTNLYGGWLAGAKLLNPGGRVILLSDGLANCGRYTDAHSLAHHAGITRERFQKITTTIGVGNDYDEALMAGMARQGGGSHYFAHNAEAIMKAFSEEQFSIDSVMLTDVRLICNGREYTVGNLWGGEIKKLVIPNVVLTGDAILVYYVRATGKTGTLPLLLPEEFGQDDEVTLEFFIQQVTEIEAEMLQVRNQQTAREMHDRLRQVVMRLLSHPLVDTEIAQAVINSANGTLGRLERLSRSYDEDMAMMHRKRSMQKAHNLSQSAKAYSSFDDVEESVVLCSVSPNFMLRPREVNDIHPVPTGLALAPIEQWRAWMAVPMRIEPGRVSVAAVNPKDGLLRREIEKYTGCRVDMILHFYEEHEILQFLEELAQQTVP